MIDFIFNEPFMMILFVWNKSCFKSFYPSILQSYMKNKTESPNFCNILREFQPIQWDNWSSTIVPLHLSCSLAIWIKWILFFLSYPCRHHIPCICAQPIVFLFSLCLQYYKKPMILRQKFILNVFFQYYDHFGLITLVSYFHLPKINHYFVCKIFFFVER